MKPNMEAIGNNKLWSMELNMPLTLSEALSSLTKHELLTLRSHFGVKGASTLKKQDLVELLVEAIPERLPVLLSLFDETRCKILKKLAAAQGGFGSFDLLEYHQVFYFKDRGLIFPGNYRGKPVLAIPQELIQGLNKFYSTPAYRETVHNNTQIIKLTQGLLYYYGALTLEELEGFLHQHAEHELHKDYQAVLRESEAFYELLRFEEEHVSYAMVLDADQVRVEQRQRSELEFYPFSTKELLEAGEPEFVDRTPSYKAFLSFIKNNYTISNEHADFLVEQCVYAIRNGEPQSRVLKQLQSDLEMDDLGTVQAIAGHIAELHNNTKQWYIKGYSSEELSPSKQAAAATSAKVGRNEPCPCGSSKKYKKCCGA